MPSALSPVEHSVCLGCICSVNYWLLHWLSYTIWINFSFVVLKLGNLKITHLFIYFRERGGERDKHQSVPPVCVPTGDRTHNHCVPGTIF